LSSRLVLLRPGWFDPHPLGRYSALAAVLLADPCPADSVVPLDLVPAADRLGRCLRIAPLEVSGLAD
jgi:hypothetical protein